MADSVIGALRVVLGIETAAFEKGLKGATASLSSIGRRMQSIGATLSASVTAPLVAIGYKSVEAFQESERALAAVEAAVKSTGGAAGLATAELSAMAAKLQSLSTFDDDEILSKVTANLLTFTNVTGAAFDRAQVAILDVSARLGQDLQSSAIMVGKALNDPILGMTALRRVGIQLSEQQQEQVRSFMAVGDVASAQGVILDELTRQFGGQAAALANTTSGALEQAKNAWGDAMEEIGAVIAEVIPPIAEAIKSAAEAFRALNPETRKWIVIIGGMAAILGPLIGMLGLFLAGIAAISAPVLAVVAAVAALTAGFILFREEITTAATIAVEMVQKIYAAVKEWIVDKLNAVWESVVSGIRQVGDAFKWLYDSVVGHSWVPDMVTGVEDWMGRLGSSFGSAIGGLIDGTLSWKDALAQLGKELINIGVQSLGSMMGGGFGNLFQSLAGSLFGFAQGGEFQVAGAGGIDSQIVAFRASPGETVNVSKDRNGAGGPTEVRLAVETTTSPLFDQRVKVISGGVAQATMIEGAKRQQRRQETHN